MLSDWYYYLHFVDEEAGSQMNLLIYPSDPPVGYHRHTENGIFKKGIMSLF